MPIRKSNDTLFYLIGIVPVVWLALLLAQSLGGGLPELLRNLTSALEQPTNIIWTDKSLPTILICLAAYGMAVLLYRTNQGRTRDGEEHGSAAWATPASVNAQFAQKDSIPLTQHVRLGLDTHKHRRSLNVLVIGGSGAAKTRSFVLPNILTANTNYVITDPKSEVLLATGGYGWGSSTICNILEKREYLGHTINFKTRKHFKDKKSHYVPEAELSYPEHRYPQDQAPRTLRQTSQGVSGNAPPDTVQ